METGPKRRRLANSFAKVLSAADSACAISEQDFRDGLFDGKFPKKWYSSPITGGGTRWWGITASPRIVLIPGSLRENEHGFAGEVKMASTAPKTLTQLLLASDQGDQKALDAVMPLVYEELHRLGRSYMRRERPGHTLQTTVLVHEAYLRLLGQDANWVNRAHFFGIAAKMMRRILIDHAKSHGRAKRGGGAAKVTLDEPALFSKSPDMDLVAVDEALRRLEAVDPQRAQIVELKFFGGLSGEEISKVMDLSTATINRQWTGARAWLYHELKPKE